MNIEIIYNYDIYWWKKRIRYSPKVINLREEEKLIRVGGGIIRTRGGVEAGLLLRLMNVNPSLIENK